MLDVEPGEGCAAVRLAPADGGGAPLTLLAPFDLLQPVAGSERPRRAHRRAAAAACAAALLDAHPWAGAGSVLDSDIRILDFQLEPALALLRGECTRLLLADEAGLGKTIQAGILLAELRSRHEADRVLIVTPAGLRDQWQRELADRCRLPVRRADAPALASAGRTLPPWVDYWSLPGLHLISIDLVKRPEVLAALAHAVWDVVVLDEAHHAAQSTERGAAAAALCARARYVVLISATPHGGDGAAFDRLLRLGAVPGDAAPMRVFRRTRADAGLGGLPRRTRWAHVRPTPGESRMHAALERYAARVWAETRDDGGARLAMIVLRKRALSSPAALARTAGRRLALLDPEAREQVQLALAFDDPHGEAIEDDDAAGPELGAPGLTDRQAERAMLEEVREAARAASACHAKLTALARALARTPEPVIVFTEYRDTLRHLEARLRDAGAMAVLHGGLLPAARAAAIDAFVNGRARVLLATDAAAEGLNLHRRCRWVVHFELPWSPVRLEQRAGRVDRIGQARRVHVWALVAAGTAEERVLMRLDARQALSEAEVARIVFGGRPPSAAHADAPAPAGRPGSREARRLSSLVRLRAAPRVLPSRPLACAVRRRGAFAPCVAGALTLFHATLADGRGRRIGAEVAARTVAGRPGSGGADAATKRRLGRGLARSASDARRFAHAAIVRAAALESHVRARARRAVQPSLFDRREARAAEREREAIARAAGYLRRAAGRAAGMLRRASAVVSTVATFEIR